MRTTRGWRLVTAILPFACIASAACFDVADLGGAGADAGTDSGRDAATSDASTTVTGGGAVPPSLPANAQPTTSTVERNFAINDLLLGDVPRGSTTQTPTAWKNFGYNLDGKISTASSTDLCTPYAGAQKALVYTDGPNGIDNSFGENILPILLNTSGTDLAAKNNEAIVAGKFSIEIDVKGLIDDPAQTNSGLGGYLNPASVFNSDGNTAPTFTTADDWPVLDTFLADKATPSTSSSAFPNAYVANGTWVSGPLLSSLDVRVTIEFGGVTFPFLIHKAVITFDHTADTKADNGTIAGVIDTEEFLATLKAIAGAISSQLCNGSALDGVSEQMRQAQDILLDGTNSAGVPCNAISIGLGFTALQIGPQTKADPTPTPPDPCDGG